VVAVVVAEKQEGVAEKALLFFDLRSGWKTCGHL
jgi:hypothetical protein